MPFSKMHFDSAIETFLTRLQPKNVLDIGAGAGKYATLLRRACPGAFVTAVELDTEYIERFKLAEKYDEVRRVNAEQLLTEVDTDYDLVIFGDVIEHLRKSVGVDLLNFFVYRSKRILVVFPLRARQGSVDGRSQEAHISIWGPEDFRTFEHSYDEVGRLAMVQITGYLSHQT